MTDQLCRNCRWWDNQTDKGPYSQPDDPEEYGPFEGVANVGFCQLTVMKDDLREHTETKAVAADGSGYHGRLLTLADFGCVQWEAKE